MTFDEIKKKHGLPKNEEIYHMTVPKSEGSEEFYEIYLREPTLAEEEALMGIFATKPFTATQTALKSLYLEGDKEFFDDKKLIKSSLKFVNTIFNSLEATLEKK